MNISHACLLLPLLFAANIGPTGDEWGRWGGPDRNGVSPESGWKSVGAEKPLWSVDVGLGCSAITTSEGLVFTRGYIGETEKNGHDLTLCLNALSGKEVWRHSSPAEPKNQMYAGGTVSTPIVDGDELYVLGRMGMLWCFEAATGNLQWERKLDSLKVEIGSFGLSSSPLVIGDNLIINAGKIVAYNKADGKQLWSTKDYGYSYGTPVPFGFKDESLIAVFNAAGLAVIDRKNGTEKALFPWTSDYNINSATPLIIGSRIFISTGYNAIGCALLEYSENGLKEVWRSKSMSNLMNGCVELDGHFYGFDTTKLKCLDPDGKELWSVRGLGRGTLIASDGRLIVISEKGELQIGAASPKGFEPTTRAQAVAQGPCWTTPSLAGGLIFCRSSLGELACLDHRAGL